MSMISYKGTKYACYFSYVASSAAFVLPPMLFAAFNEIYHVSYTLLGTLVLVNFFTQLILDLIFTFFSKHFNIKATIRIMPLLTSLGFLIYALIPMLLPQHAYSGLLAGTIVFSAASGLGEVLLSPTIAAIPSDTPDKDMSILHSLYGYGVVSVVIISSIFIKLFTVANWMYLVMFYAVLPIITFVFFCIMPLPEMDMTSQKTNKNFKNKAKILTLCTFCIFLGSAAENTMTNWISTFMENALNLPKLTGDIFGFMVFAILLALTRTFYAKYGKDIMRTLIYGMIGSAVCYVVIAFSSNAAVSAVACVLVGICTSMLWPGTLILMEEKLPGIGVAAYALMAAGGDFGGSLAPQIVGAVVDFVSASNWSQSLTAALNITAEQLGMKAGMLSAAAFPILGIFLTMYMRSYFTKNK